MKTRLLRRWPLGLLLAVALVCAAAMPIDKVKLRLNLKEGDSFRFKVVVDQVINQTVMGQEQIMTLSNIYRLVGREAGKAQIKVECAITPNSGDPITMGGMTLAYAVSGTQQGTMWLDEASGLPVQATITQHVAGDVTMNGSTSWPIEIETKNVMETQK